MAEFTELDITQHMIQAGRHAANLPDGTLARIYVEMRSAERGWDGDDRSANPLRAISHEVYQEALRQRDRESERANAAMAENARLREALAFYADEQNYRMNAPLDPNSGRFEGNTRARAALTPTT